MRLLALLMGEAINLVLADQILRASPEATTDLGQLLTTALAQLTHSGSVLHLTASQATAPGAGSILQYGDGLDGGTGRACPSQQATPCAQPQVRRQRLLHLLQRRARFSQAPTSIRSVGPPAA